MRTNRPTTLYKYKDISGDGIEHVVEMLRGNRIWFSSPLNFNDPFDCRCIFDTNNTREAIVLRKALYLMQKKGFDRSDAISIADAEIPTNPSDLEEWQVRQINGHSQRAEKSGILSLTSEYNNFLMWTHYAKDHTGICIEFSIANIHNTAHLDFIGSAQPVEYSDRCPKINIVRDEKRDIIRKAFLTKSTAFCHEREWRIVRYDEGVGLKEIPSGIIGGIIFGCNIDGESRLR